MPRIVVPQGDVGGIGPEVALSALTRPDLRARLQPLILGHLPTLRAIAAQLEIPAALHEVGSAAEGFASPAEVLPVLPLESAPSEAPPGSPHADFGFAAVEAVLRGGQLCLDGEADALVTPPIHKESMHLAGYPYEGQTQILGELCGSRRYGMLACSGSLRVLVATRHMSLRQALERLDVNLVAKQIRIAHEAAREALGMEQPRIVLAGLNPHAGEGGAFGSEERKILRPAIEKAQEEWGFETAGPAVPDVVFGEGREGRWDIVIALYHDQAFIPLKLLGRDEAFTLFVGGGLLRLSPMHGAAYDIARTGRADAGPMVFTLERALDLCAQRATAG